MKKLSFKSIALYTCLVFAFLLLMPIVTQAQDTRPDNQGIISQLLQGSKNTGNLFGAEEDELLPGDEAYRFSATIKDAQTLTMRWTIADGYYLYREKVKLMIQDGLDTQLGSFTIPDGKAKHDETFGDVEIFYHELAFDVPLIRTSTDSEQINVLAKFQGCADRGVCYPPMEKTVSLSLPPLQSLSSPVDLNTASKSPLPNSEGNNFAPVAEQDSIAAALKGDTLWLTLLTFLGFGLLLAFTPCVFPMIPILSGIIIGQGKTITTARAFLLSLAYVLASALAYTLFGVLAGLFGSNLQAAFQHPAILIAFSALFVVLSLSMFGFYELQMPSWVQSKITSSSNQQRGGSIISAAIMGLLSALIVGPCVAAPLAGALIYIGQTGDAVLGGGALFAMGLGMGIPLLILGTSAGTLLPKAGNWMNATKAIFGVGLLAVAVWLLERILPASVTMTLWAMLLIIPAVYMGAVDALPESARGWHKLWKGLGLVFFAYGLLLLIGVTSGSHDPLQPLGKLASSTKGGLSAPTALEFKRIASITDLDAQLLRAGSEKRWVMLDYYADWCISCKEMERDTFSDPQVQAALKQFKVLQADVTKNSTDDKALLQRFGLIGPPAILFFDPDSQEHRAFRVVGYQDTATFLNHIKKLLANAE